MPCEKTNPYSARVILWDHQPESSPEPKIIHSMKVRPTGTLDPEAYERALRETITLNNGFVSVATSDQLCETLPHLPDLSFMAHGD
jgi:hypothetical protein